MTVLNPDKLIDVTVDAIHSHMTEAGAAHLTVAVSGGVDSAVILGLAVRAVGPNQVVAAYIDIDSSKESLDNARLVCRTFGVSLIEIGATKECGRLLSMMRDDIDTFTDQNVETTVAREQADPTIVGSLRSTFRAPIIHHLNRTCGLGSGLVLGTGNECEDRIFGFFNKYGDGAVDANPIARLSKGEVRQLALALGVPLGIVMTTPTPDLWGCGNSHSDEVELTTKSDGVPWSYSTVDANGQYTGVGTIELLSRLADKWDMFADASMGHDMEALMEDSPSISGQVAAARLTVDHVLSGISWERKTRHKRNPNCPSYLDRELLVANGVLTNKMPDVPLVPVVLSDEDSESDHVLAKAEDELPTLNPTGAPALGLDVVADVDFSVGDGDDDWFAARTVVDDVISDAEAAAEAPTPDPGDIETFATPGIEALVDELEGKPPRETFAERSAKRRRAATANLTADARGRRRGKDKSDEGTLPPEGGVNKLITDAVKANTGFAARGLWMLASSIVSGD